MNKTVNDFNKEVNRVKQNYLDDQIKYQLPFKFETNETEFAHTFIISNKKLSTVVTLDKTFGYLNTLVMGRYQLEKCLQMQNEIEKNLY